MHSMEYNFYPFISLLQRIIIYFFNIYIKVLIGKVSKFYLFVLYYNYSFKKSISSNAEKGG